MLDPVGDRRADYRSAKMTAMLMDALGARKTDGTRFTVEDCRLRFDVTPAPAPAPAQTATQIDRRLASWIGGSNAMFREGGKRSR